MAGEIHITKDFPPARERAVLLELLHIMRALQAENIDAMVCGGWVPFLKELARAPTTSHSMSFDIDVLLRAKAREREAVDRINCHVAEFARPDRPIAEPIPNSRHDQRLSSGWLCQAARGTAGDGFQGNLHDNK